MTGNKIPLEIIRFFRWKIAKERLLPRNMPKIPLFVIGLLQLAITWYKSAMLEGKVIIIPALGH